MELSRSYFKGCVPGALICAVIALSATFLSEHYGGPQLLYALLIGLSLHFLSLQESTRIGINFCAKTVLRIGVALLGIRITLGQVSQLGMSVGVVLVLAVALTVGTGLLLARWLKRPIEEGLLSGGSVGICGASAAMAISSVLPQTKENERFTLLAVVGVTVLSTTAMVLYPFFMHLLDLSPVQSGIFLGGTIHDVAQVVAAGMMMGQEAGDAATVVKLFRVVLLMPVVLLIAFSYRRHAGAATAPGTVREKVPLVPTFLIGFMGLVLVASTGRVPAGVVASANDISRWCLVIAISAAGVKTSFEDLKKLGWQPVAMLVTETAVIATFVLAAIWLLKLGVH
ncbi:Inner membrane protein [Polaromonas sp. CG9_12]|nr:Inner membrane protein [Polaromonas sp. CG9_12]